jgi:hypothetical protein
MIFNLLTFLAALSVAGVAEWFSIVGIISIYAGAPYNAGLILGLVLGFAKLVNTSWLYRNWDNASWKIKGPLIYFLLALMMATSMGVFGFLTKSHLEQGAATVDNSAKVERLDQQIAREKSTIADDEKVIAQLDASINSYIGKDKTDKAVTIRKSQAPQRKQLRDDIDASQKKIDGYSEDKLKLTSQVRALQLEVGPIRYIAELFYGTDGDQSAKIESAVKMFTLLIVSTLDPLAIILLIAANHTLMRRQNEEKEKVEKDTGRAEYIEHEMGLTNDPPQTKEEIEAPPESKQTGQNNERMGGNQFYEDQNPTVDAESVAPSIGEVGIINEEEKVDSNPTEDNIVVLEPEEQLPDTALPEVIISVQDSETVSTEIPTIPAEVLLLNEEESTNLEKPAPIKLLPSNPVIRSPSVSRVAFVRSLDPIATSTTAMEAAPVESIQATASPPIEQSAVIRELLGNQPHFIPQKINEEAKQSTASVNVEQLIPENERAKTTVKSAIAKAVQTLAEDRSGQIQKENSKENAQLEPTVPALPDKYPIRLSWLKEFKGD